MASSQDGKNTRFPLAALSQLAKGDRDDQANAAHENAAALVAALRDLHHHLLVAQPHYVYSDPITFGGPTTGQMGAYALANEFGSPCQFAVLQVAFSGAGTASVGPLQELQAPAATAVIDPTSRLHAQTFSAAAATTISGAEDAWTDLPASASVYLAVNVTTDGAWATVQFRRRVSPGGVFAEGHS